MGGDSAMNAPTATNVETFQLGPPIDTLSDSVSQVFYGDPILSIRTLMKRYIYYAKWPFLPSNAATTKTCRAVRTRYFFPDYPLYQGQSPTGMPFVLSVLGKRLTPTSSSKTQCKWNCVTTSFMNWFTPAYVCRRGGIRWKYSTTFSTHVQAADGDTIVSGPTGSMTVSRCPNTAMIAVETPTTATEKPTDVAYASYKSLPSGAGGIYATQTSVQPTVEVELPFYNYNRFVPGFRRKFTKTGTIEQGVDNNDYPFHQVVVESLQSTRTSSSFISSYVAAADDFSLFFYVGPPVLYDISTTKTVVEQKPADSLFT